MRFPVYTFLLILGVSAVAFDAAIAQDGSKTASPTIQIEAELPRQQVLDETGAGYGTVTTSGAATNDISFLHGGRITKLYVQTGDRVLAGQPLVEISADPTATHSYEKAVAALEFTRRELARTTLLLEQHLATNAQVALAQKSVDDAAAVVATERKLGNDQQKETARAQFDAFVVKVSVAPGDRVQANASLLVLARMDLNARVVLGLEADDARRVTPGMTARVHPILGESRVLVGKVAGVSGSVNPTTKLIEASVLLDSTADKIADGTSVSVAIVLASFTGWVVPRQAVLHDDKGDYLFQVDGHVARRVEVQTGVQTDKMTAVTGNFNPALKVVTLGNYELKDGMTVREAPPTSPK